MKFASAALLTFAAIVPAFAATPAWDSSGNSQLNGTYYFRQVIYAADSGGNASAFYAYYGNIVFNGAGGYSITSGTFLSDSSSGFQENTAATLSGGTYSVSASGFGFLSSPVISAATGQPPVNVIFLVSNHILIGSETESGYNDMFVAAPYNSGLSLGSLSGSYTISSFFPGGTPASAADATFQLNPNGAGSLGTVSISGYSGAGATLTQNSSGVKYAYSNGAYTVSFPSNNSANFYSGGTNGLIFLYSSPDSNFVFGGGALGFDMFVGVKNATGSAATALSGLYYTAGIDASEQYAIDTYYGSFNAFQGNIIEHERILQSGFSAEGETYYTTYTPGMNPYTDPTNTVQYTVGGDGIRIGYGIGGSLGIEVALPYTPPAVTASIYLDPTGIVNTASSAPFTAGISPGDFITIYNGTNLANSTVFAPPGAFQTTLGGVTVVVDGVLPAPLFYVSPTQISFLVPYGASTYSVASIQVKNNGANSNIATTYVNLTTPGVFTANPVGGTGVAAMLDFPASGAAAYIVSESKPANPGDAVAVFVSGLGAPFPSNGDGALGPLTGDSLVQNIYVDVSGTDVGTLAYAGLAPGLAGLYQINFTVPSTATAGDNLLGISGPDSYSNESIIPISSGASSAAVAGTTPAVKPALHRTLPPRFFAPAAR